jgi:hypothetical protein
LAGIAFVEDREERALRHPNNLIEQNVAVSAAYPCVALSRLVSLLVARQNRIFARRVGQLAV